MNVFLVHIDKREGDGEILGVYNSKQRAIRAVEEFVYKRFSEIDIPDLLKVYDSDLSQGIFITEEYNVYVVERTVKGDDDIDGDIA